MQKVSRKYSVLTEFPEVPKNIPDPKDISPMFLATNRSNMTMDDVIFEMFKVDNAFDVGRFYAVF